ncbi:hypothetical protein WN944_022514 [Citrus x changshan-huyou]|uniref:Uncharacterized protein n=1 Tax=Citrus x changshan-huyou TaxID=2935761 RepID=A0AAP0N324_9ROSI
MVSYKLDAAKRAQKQLHGDYTFEHIVDQLKDLALQIRACYHKKAAHNVILRDLVMLENQIPLFVLRKMLEIQYSSLESADDMLMSMLKGFLFPQQNVEKKSDDESSTSSKPMNKPPLVEEITIPSITEPAKSNVCFLPTVGNISTVSFDAKKAILHLPTISLDFNTEVVLRNVVAYEASSASGPLVLTRYTELMNGIIDTEEDAKFLREKGVIVNR